MSLYILDTDHLTLHRYGHPEGTARVHGTPAEQLAMTIVSIEEQLMGGTYRFAKVGISRSSQEHTKGYFRWLNQRLVSE